MSGIWIPYSFTKDKQLKIFSLVELKNRILIGFTFRLKRKKFMQNILEYILNSLRNFCED
jgi:hypothetical protein